jgi:hypothetical protein
MYHRHRLGLLMNLLPVVVIACSTVVAADSPTDRDALATLKSTSSPAGRGQLGLTGRRCVWPTASVAERARRRPDPPWHRRSAWSPLVERPEVKRPETVERQATPGTTSTCNHRKGMFGRLPNSPNRTISAVFVPFTNR